ncbi:MAG: hypothetical protein RR348_00650, partial [Clostridia bacterium]
PAVEFGKTKPTGITPKVAISKDMTAIEMFEAGIQNYYESTFVTKLLEETVSTNLGAISSNQYVDSVVYRMGVADENATYLVDNRTGSSFVKMWEESVFRGTSKIDFRVALKDNVKYNASSKTGKFEKVKNWNEEQDYSSVDEYVKNKAANPTKIWPFITNSDTMQEQSKVWYDGVSDTYRFSLLFNVEEAVGEYGNVLKYNLEAAGNKLKDFKYETLKYEVVMWSNGLLRSVNITQVYDMKMEVNFGIKFSGNSRNVSTGFSQFTYNEDEVSGRIEQLKSFEKQQNEV